MGNGRSMGVAWVRLELGRESGRGIGVGCGSLTGGEKHDACGEGPGEAGEGGLLSKGHDAHDDAGGGTEGGQDHAGPGGIPVRCGSTPRSLLCCPCPQRRGCCLWGQECLPPLHIPDPALSSRLFKHPPLHLANSYASSKAYLPDPLL